MIRFKGNFVNENDYNVLKRLDSILEHIRPTKDKRFSDFYTGEYFISNGNLKKLYLGLGEIRFKEEIREERFFDIN